jgi:hypothetical protein
VVGQGHRDLAAAYCLQVLGLVVLLVAQALLLVVAGVVEVLAAVWGSVRALVALVQVLVEVVGQALAARRR